MSKKFNFIDRIKGFKYAFNGIKFTLLTQHNFLIHLFCAAAAIAMGYYFNISKNEWLAIIIVIGLVLAAEVFNTAIEEVVNMISPQRNIKAGIIKDLAAGAVLILAITALIIGLIIFIPKIFI